MSEFTQGKWKVVYYEPDFVAIVDEDNEPIQLTEANARLIAAAPDMYKALTLAMDFLRDGNFPAQLIADRIQVLLARIDGKDADDD